MGSEGLDAYLTLGDRQTRRESLPDPQAVLRQQKDERVALDNAHLAPSLVCLLVAVARQEVWGILLGDNWVRVEMDRAAEEAGEEPRRISFVNARPGHLTDRHCC